MENKVVCYYCGTIYDADAEKCPLCGGTVRAKEEESLQPIQRRRITDQERRERRRSSSHGGKFASGNKKRTETTEDKEKKTTKSMLIAALVMLSLAVISVTWFIGDMIGWWGGFEDAVERPNESVEIDFSNEKCQYLSLSEKTIQLENIGQSAELKISVNVECREEIRITFPDAAIVTAVSDQPSQVEDDTKSDIWLLTAVSEGKAQMVFACGEFHEVCDIYVGKQAQPTQPDVTEDPTEPIVPDEDFEPVLNFTEDISLYQKGESVPLRVMNLPAGATVTWKSADETVAKVDENGILTAVGGGTTTITAEVFGKSTEIMVRCPFDQSGNIGAHLEYTDVTIRVGESYYLYLYDSEGYRITDVVYEVSDDGVVSIEDGKVTGVTGGDYVVITVKYNNEEFECIVRVRW